MKAMMGIGIDPRTLQLMDEIRSLRARVVELEEALATADQVQRLEDEAPVRLDVAAVLETAAGR